MPHPSNGRVEHDLLFRRTRYDYGWMVAWIPLVAAKMNEGRMHSNLHFFLKCEVRVGNNVITAKFHCKIFALFRKIDRNWKVEGERIVLLFEWYMKQLLRVPSFEMYRNVPLNWKCEANATQSKPFVRLVTFLRWGEFIDECRFGCVRCECMRVFVSYMWRVAGFSLHTCSIRWFFFSLSFVCPIQRAYIRLWNSLFTNFKHTIDFLYCLSSPMNVWCASKSYWNQIFCLWIGYLESKIYTELYEWRNSNFDELSSSTLFRFWEKS